MYPAYDLRDSDYYERRPGEGLVQGDVFDGVPFFYTSANPATKKGWQAYTNPAFTTIGVVCSYTRVHSTNPYRQVAPLLTVEELVNRHGLDEDMGALLKRRRRALGYMYVPHPGDHREPAVVCLFRATLVHQNLLDELHRIARFSPRAQRILVSQLIEVVSGNLPDPDAPGLVGPNLSVD